MPATPPQLCVLDGQLMPAAEATISVLDEGLLRGDGVFEGLRLTDGAVYALDEHLERMERSAQNMRLPLDAHAVRADVEQLAAAAPGASGIVRTIVTRGGRRITLLEPSPDPAGSVALASVPYAPTRVLDAVKSLSYGANMLATRLAKEAGADEAVLTTPHGRVLEAPTRSLFAVLGGVLRTPPLSDHILDSITRRAVLQVAEVLEEPMTLEDLRRADEAFLASTTHEVLPIHRVDDVDLPAAPGPMTRLVGERVAAHVRAAL
jgi:branched-chain amino acid aminotransferase